jgi:hypothetical protein
MPKPRLYDESLYIRAPKGTKALIDELRGSERQADFVRRVFLGALEELKGGQVTPAKRKPAKEKP